VAERFFSTGPKGILLSVRAKPGARKDAVLGVRAGELLVAVRARPEKGRANAEVIRTIAEALGISRTGVVLKRGGGSQHKVFHLPAAALPALEALEARAARGAPGLQGDQS
jgi:uncharacterized protein YggU (UPF0235/DUF167 family)